MNLISTKLKGWAMVLFAAVFAVTASAASKKPNIVVLWGDDIGYWNPSCYNRGMMGYRWVYNDYESGSGRNKFGYDVLSQGPQVGFTAHF